MADIEVPLESLSQSQKKRGRRPKSHQYASGIDIDAHNKGQAEAEPYPKEGKADALLGMPEMPEKTSTITKPAVKTPKTPKTPKTAGKRALKGSLSKSVSAEDMDARADSWDEGEPDADTFMPSIVPLAASSIIPIPGGDSSMGTAPATAATTASTSASKKSRKNTKIVYNTMETAAINTDDDHVIIKLNIKESMISEDVDTAKGNAEGLYAYNASYHTFESKPFEISSFGDAGLFQTPLPMAVPTPVMPLSADMDMAQGEGGNPNENPAVSSLKVIHLLREFEHKNMNNEWPASTSIHCYWCCHKFDGPPFGIPVKLYKEKFYVTGCFCSLECAAAYNFESKDGLQQKFEQYHLMNAIARKIGYAHDVKRAPSRLALKMFGGHLSIEQFRGFCHTSKLININFPPMMTLTQQLEEINQSDLDNDYKYVPIDTDRVNKYKEKIKLKRSKPLTNFKNTLDHTMNLKIAPSQAAS